MATILIKKYSNRKLYDQSHSRYVTLDEIALLVREGHEVRVVDATSGEDLTGVTLAQVILENERAHKTAFPPAFLHQLIKHGEMAQQTFQKLMTASLDAFISGQQEAGRAMRDWAARAGWVPPGPEPKGAEPREGEPASEETEVRVLYDTDALYFGVVARDSDPDRIIINPHKLKVDELKLLVTYRPL